VRPLADRNNLPRPEEFPLGSMESRAAARAVLEQRDKVDLRLIVDICGPERDGPRSYRCRQEDGTIVEFVIP